MSDANTDKFRAALLDAAKEIDRLRKKLATLEAAAHEPIAIIGIGLRLPGGVVDLRTLWDLLERRIDAVQSFPSERWDTDSIYDPDPDAVGKSYVRDAAFLDSIDQFDPEFFNISPREAASIDPQHRLLLEAAWESLEHASIRPSSLAGSRTGVFVGTGPSDYGSLDRDTADPYAIMGTHMSFAAGRVAFTLGLHGPAVATDTACSSSLVALHLAVSSLRARESTLALAGGVQLMAAPDNFVHLSGIRALAPDGRCKTFSANADGYGRGEGVIVLALERLDDALVHHRQILAVVRGSAVNHDGRSSSITAPNGSSQQKVLRAALADAKLGPTDVDFIECHGTGTSLGDPIEVNALAAVYGEGRPLDRPLLLGAIKTNIGHLESAAGLAGVAKLIAAFEHDTLPATLHSQPPNPHIDWSALPVAVVGEPRAWPPADRPRRAGVSGFGLSGTNAHVILEHPPTSESRAPSTPPRAPVPVLISARTPEALRAQVGRVLELVERDAPDLVDLATTCALGRTHFEHRAAILANDLTSLTRGLRADVSATRLEPNPKLTVLFTGQGAQHPEMGAALHRAFPEFRDAFDSACASFDPYLDLDLRELIFAAPDPERPSLLDQTRYTQPALFAIEVALFRLFCARGITPSFLVGHSIGEIVAAHVAEVFSLADACKLVAARAKLMQSLPSGGAMFAIEASEPEVLAALTHGVDIAGINGPTATVISGDEPSAAAIARQFERRGRKTTRLTVSHAFHSQRIEPILAELQTVARSLKFAEPTLPIASNVTGALARPGELTSPEYWARHARGTVRFLDGIREVERHGANVMLELGPRGVLSSMAFACLANPDPVALIPTLRQAQPEPDTVVSALAQLHCVGVTVDWASHFGPRPPRPIALPFYPFQRTRCWAATAKLGSNHTRTSSRYPLAGERIDLPDGGSIHRLAIGPSIQHYLADHIVHDHIVVPGAFYIAVLLAIAEAHWPGHPLELSDVEFIRALTFRDAREQTPLAVRLAPSEPDDLFATIQTRDAEATWITHATATLRRLAQPLAPAEPIDVALPRWTPAASLGPQLDAVQIHWGPRWWWMQASSRSSATTVLGQFAPHESVPIDDAPLAPGLVDNSFALGAWLTDFSTDGVPRLPFGVGRVTWYGQQRTPSFARYDVIDDGAANITFFDHQGASLATIERYISRLAPASKFLPHSSEQDTFTVAWHETRPAQLVSGSWSVIGAHAAELGSQLPGDAMVGETLEVLPDASPDAPYNVVVSFDVDSHEPGNAATLALRLVQAWLRRPSHRHHRLILLTRSAVACSVDQREHSLAGAAIWGLVRTAQAEAPDHPIILVDTDRIESTAALLARLPIDTANQFAIRGSALLIPRLQRPTATTLQLRKHGGWRLEVRQSGSLDGLAIEPRPPLALQPSQVELAVVAAGVNFRDVLNTLGMYPGGLETLDGDAAGVVSRVGDAVTDLRVGDRVTGMVPWAFADSAIVDAELVTRFPPSWTFVDAASVPVAYLTAFYALVRLAKLEPGQRVLIHAAAGGVGLAAIHIAKHCGAEVFGTASPSKWSVLRELGLPPAHIASSRTLEFEPQFQTATRGRGFDVVFNSLAGPFTDASLRLVARSGRFIEIGKTDLRDPDQVRDNHAVHYEHFNLAEFPPSVVRAMFDELAPLLESGALPPLPTTAWDVRRARDAFRHMGQAKHVGKVVLTIPRRFDPTGTVLITGGTGGLGAVIARHFASRGALHILLISRTGERHPSAPALRRDLETAGASVSFAACDVGDRAALAHVLDSISEQRRLTAVIHTAGIIDDVAIETLDEARLQAVFRSKVDGAIHLDELTRRQPLAAFVLFSSISGVLGSPGQANYAAANATLDALAAARVSRGLPALSLAWGPWAEAGMAARLSDASKARMASRGFPLLDPGSALDLLDAALAGTDPQLVLARLDLGAMRKHGEVPPLLTDLVPIARASHGPTTQPKWRLLDHESDRTQLSRLIVVEACVVLGLADPTVLGHRSFSELGLDSLMAVELRNRLTKATGVKLSPTLLFENDSVEALTTWLERELAHSPIASKPPSGPAPDSATRMLRALHSAAASSAARTPADQHDYVLRLLRDAYAAGSSASATQLLTSLAELRRATASSQTEQRPVSLGSDPQRNQPSPIATFYCIPSVAAPSTPLQFVKLAPALARIGPVWSAANPGYEPDTAPIIDVERFVDHHLQLASQCRADLPLVLVGYSAGGWLALDLAARLERLQQPAAGLVLLDSPSTADADRTASFTRRSIDNHLSGGSVHSTQEFVCQLTSMAAAFAGYREWRGPANVETPSLFVHAAHGIPLDGELEPIRFNPHALWSPRLPHLEVQQLQCDHFDLVADAAGETAAAIRMWAEHTLGRA